MKVFNPVQLQREVPLKPQSCGAIEKQGLLQS